MCYSSDDITISVFDFVNILTFWVENIQDNY